MIETERLILRPPRDADRDALFALNADPRVGEWLAGPLSREDSDALVDRVLASIEKHGFSLWPVERKVDGAVIGMAGLIAMGDDLPPGPALEVGWRFASDTWGKGYATEAARAAIDWGFANRPDAPEIVAITARTNLRSQAVMRRLGMVHEPWRDFDHPKVADDSPLKAHVTYSLKRPR
ncbi:MAG: GNAT family N-acetyltransferase [Caulobacterales bacterium]|jgi:RimJ/RimL family protein N-acetyltransferase